MPLSSVTSIQFDSVFAFIERAFRTDVFVKAIYRKHDLTAEELETTYTIGTDILGDKNVFLTAYYENQPITEAQQARIDATIIDKVTRTQF